MPKQSDDGGNPPGLSRRNMLKAGIAAAALPAAITAPAKAADMAGMAMPAAGHKMAPMPDIEALETLNAGEADLLEAICARLVPTDELGPGAKEARVAHYIDRSLAGPLNSLRETYASGLAALDAYAQSAKGGNFVDLSADDQDLILHDLESNKATGFTPNSASFFSLLRGHTVQGMFCDPYYGGNKDFIGWDLISYPGIRMPATADDQRLTEPPKLRELVYQSGMFARGGSDGH